MKRRYVLPLALYVLTSFLHLPILLMHGRKHRWAMLLGYGPDSR